MAEFDEAKAVEKLAGNRGGGRRKLRAELLIEVDVDEATVKAEAVELENVARRIEGKTRRKQI